MSKANFFQLATSAGIEVEYSRGRRHPRTGELVPYELNLNAPEGKWFNTSACESDCSMSAAAETVAPDWSKACDELREIIAAGLMDAEDETTGR